MDNIEQITNYFNIGLIVLFIVLVVGLGLALLRGFRRGVWKSTHNMFFMLGLIFLAFFTLAALTEFIGSFDLTQFIRGSFYIRREIDGEVVTYWVPITSVKETLTNFIQGFYTLFNVSASPKAAYNFAIALSTSVLKVVIFIVEMLLIVIFGNFFSFLTWFLIFRHFVPKIAQKLVKIRWLGMIETGVTFVVVTFLFMTPFTSLVNSLNQSYQRHKPDSDNEMVISIGNFVDAYNNSLFAKILFNWTVDESGMTLDTRLFDAFTTGISEDVSIGIVGELANITNLVIAASQGITSSTNSQFEYDPAALITQEFADLAFDVLIESDLVNTVLPVVVEIALNSDFLDQYLPGRLVDMSDVEWSKEITYVKEMVDYIFESGVVSPLKSFEGNDLVAFIDDIINSDKFDTLLNAFKAIDNSKVLSRAVPALIQYVINSDEKGTAKQFLPLSWQELNEFSWGYECYILFDFLHKVASIDEDFVKAIFANSGVYKTESDDEIKTLPTLISEHADEFKTLLVGEFDKSGNPVNVDKHGRTIVFNKGERIQGRNYCLFDMALLSKCLPSILNNLFEMDAFKDIKTNLNEQDLAPYREAVSALNNGVRLSNYKVEFNAILDVVTTVAKDEELMNTLIKGQGFNGLMKEEGNFFSIDKAHILYFKNAIGKMDKSSLLYSALTPIVKSFLKKESTDYFLYDIGIRSDVLVSAINQDIKRENHTFFADLSQIFDQWDDLGTIYSLTSATGNTNALMDKLADEDTVNALVDLLKIIRDNEIFNPTPERGDDFEKNENLYGLLEFIFSNTKSMGLEVTRPLMREVKDWDKEFDAIGKILHHIATRDVMNASSLFSGGLTVDGIRSLKGDGPTDINLPELFKLVDDSHLFANSLGSFLDEQLGSSGLIDKENNVSFANVKEGEWTAEGQSLARLLDTLEGLVDEGGSDFLSSFDLNKVSQIVDLNDMLHELANSSIFDYVDNEGVRHYQFGTWFYSKIDSSMGSFTVNKGRVGEEKSYDLLADPKTKENATWDWNASWGVRPGDDGTVDPLFQEWKDKYDNDLENPKEETHYIAYRDFININGYNSKDSDDYEAMKVFWCNYSDDDVDDGKPGYKSLYNTFVEGNSAKLTGVYKEDNDWGQYFGSDAFVSAYNDVFVVDEISRVSKVMTYALRVMQPKADNTTLNLDDIPSDLLGNFLTSLNDTCCMRIGLYNFYTMASESIFKNDNGFSLSTAYNAYIVDADEDILNYEEGRETRQVELDKLVDFYAFIEEAKAKGIMSNGSFDMNKLQENEGFLDKTETAMKELNDSYVFQCKGSAIANELTVFQGILKKIFSDTNQIQDVIYLGDNSPKDKANTELYDSKIAKIQYLITDIFEYDSQLIDKGLEPATEKAKQDEEIHRIFLCVDSLYSMKDKDGNKIQNPDNIEIKNVDADATVVPLLTRLNQSELLYDCVPNIIYNMFVKDGGKMQIKNGDETVDFTRTDPFYHYYFDNKSQRDSIDFTAKYLSSDINSIKLLIDDYQEFDAQSGGGTKDLSDRVTLKALTGEGGALKALLKDMHAANIFHTPARKYTGVTPYYTSAYEDNGFTLFEEMMGKLCTFVKLDDFSYDSSYAGDVTNYGSASAKLKARVKAVTLADDTGTSPSVYFHTGKGTAWNQEIDAILKLANDTTDMSSDTTLNVSSIQFDKLSPDQIQTMLNSVNHSDIVSDALPKFIKQGFDSVGLGKMSTYDYDGPNKANYNYYRLGQEIYDLYEIGSIHDVMESISEKDGEGNFTGYIAGLSSMNMESFSTKTLDGLVKYVYRSRILNTKADGTYNRFNDNDGHNVTAQGILVYNTLGTDLTTYIAKDTTASTADDKTPLEKIASLSKIVHMQTTNEAGEDLAFDDIGYLVESTALNKMVAVTKDNTTGIKADSITTISSIKSRKGTIMTIVQAAYDADGDGSNHRSYIVSEFASGLFNKVFEIEYPKIDTKGYAYNGAYLFGELNADLIDHHSYDDVNELEYNGVDGVLSMLDDLGEPISPVTMKTNRVSLKDHFALMGSTPGENSMFGRIIYLAETHKALNDYLVPHGFDAVDVASSDPADLDNVYSATFSFAEYGDRLKTFLDAYVP